MIRSRTSLSAISESFSNELIMRELNRNEFRFRFEFWSPFLNNFGAGIWFLNQFDSGLGSGYGSQIFNYNFF